MPSSPDPPEIAPLSLGHRNEVGANHPLSQTAREDQALVLRYRESGDLAARDELVSRVGPVVSKLARRYNHGSESLDDLLQVANLGLLKAIERYDPERGDNFMRFAAPTILGELKRHFRDNGWAVHVPRSMQERVLDVNRTIEELSARLGRSPSPAEVADKLEITPEDVLDALEARSAYRSVSVDGPRHNDEDGETSLLGVLGTADEGYELVEDSAAVLPALAALPEREREIVRLRFDEDLTQSEIANLLGISQMHVSRLLRRALQRVRIIATGGDGLG